MGVYCFLGVIGILNSLWLADDCSYKFENSPVMFSLFPYACLALACS